MRTFVLTVYINVIPGVTLIYIQVHTLVLTDDLNRKKIGNNAFNLGKRGVGSR